MIGGLANPDGQRTTLERLEHTTGDRIVVPTPAVNAKTPPYRAGFLDMLGSLTITYFHTGIRTIIGVESFHGPVR
ncbi:MAG: hypothetical protein WBR17_32270, partial [Paraburkholderia sp.]|uniref:hypothetical protein n=1 Tax=Paraburkholderia sp. TaxID=1926495 RepID=UPI003C3694D2